MLRKTKRLRRLRKIRSPRSDKLEKHFISKYQDMMVSRTYKVETFLDDGEVEGIKDDHTI